jgi:hypothetical protein
MNKQLKLFCSCMLLLFIYTNGTAQYKINKGEYYIDIDAGIRLGTAYPILAADSVSVTLNVPLPNNLSIGAHNIYHHTFADKDDSLYSYTTYDSNGSVLHYRYYTFPQKVGATEVTPFNVQGKFVKAEYFFDADPGFGNGIYITVPNNFDSINQNLNITIPSNMQNGIHNLYVRTLVDNGNGFDSKWSQTNVMQVNIYTAISKAEFFIDTDPGFGNGTPITFTPTGDSANIINTIPMPTNIASGQHQLYVRTFTADGINTGVWGMPAAHSFYVLPIIIAAEYFFDTDPGFGNAIPLAINTPYDSIVQSSSISTMGLQSGSHNIYLRTRTADGIWGMADAQSIYIQPKIIAYQYWIDSIVQPLANTIINLPTPSDSVNFTTNIILPCNLIAGNHLLYVSTLSDAGKWSLPEINTFVSTPFLLSPINIAANANPIAAGQNLILTATSSLPATYTWASTTLTSTTAVLNAVVNITNNGTYTVTATNVDGCTTTNTIAITVTQGIKLALKLLLSGPFNTTNNLMNDDLRLNNLIPIAQPYGIAPYNVGYNLINSGTETIGNNVLNITGPNAIVDWVFVQMRSKLDSNIVLQTKSALLQRDGDVVEANDGISPIYFLNTSPDLYFVSVKHRNHIGVMTASKITIGANPISLDFTDINMPLFLKASPLNNNLPLSGATRIQNNKRALYAGNCLISTLPVSKIITYNNTTSSDRAAMLNITGGTATINGYSIFDLDLNGYARFNGVNPDRVVMLNNCLGSTSIIINEQTPN